MKGYGGVGVIAPICTLVLDGGERIASCPCHFTHIDRALVSIEEEAE
jgi:hypothetical protein